MRGTVVNYSAHPGSLKKYNGQIKLMRYGVSLTDLIEKVGVLPEPVIPPLLWWNTLTPISSMDCSKYDAKAFSLPGAESTNPIIPTIRFFHPTTKVLIKNCAVLFLNSTKIDSVFYCTNYLDVTGIPQIAVLDPKSNIITTSVTSVIPSSQLDLHLTKPLSTYPALLIFHLKTSK